MRGVIRFSLLLLPLLVATGCPASSSGSGGRRSRTDVITLDEINRAQWANAHDLVASLRPRWLIRRGEDTIMGEPGEVQVVMDGVRMGGVSALRNVSTSGLAELQFFDPMTAAARWGPGFQHGAIYITSRTR